MNDVRATPVNPNGPAAENRPVDEYGLSMDEIFHLLQCRRRRDALRYLREHDGPVRMRDLAEQVAAWEHDTTVRDLASAQRKRVYIPLYQTHLPKLDDAGVIDYQQSRGVVERTPLADVLEPYLHDLTTAPVPAAEGGSDGAEPGPADDPTETDDDAPRATDGGDPPSDWTRYYIGASGLGLALVGGSVFGLPAISTLSGTAVGTIVSGLFAALTTAHSLDARAARHAH